MASFSTARGVADVDSVRQLVSQWRFASQAAVQITTRMLEEAAMPGVGPAEANCRDPCEGRDNGAFNAFS